jgi:hypothetical protein
MEVIKLVPHLQKHLRLYNFFKGVLAPELYGLKQPIGTTYTPSLRLKALIVFDIADSPILQIADSSFYRLQTFYFTDCNLL